MEDSQLPFTSSSKVHKGIPYIKALTFLRNSFTKSYLCIISILTPILPIQFLNWFPTCLYHLSENSLLHLFRFICICIPLGGFSNKYTKRQEKKVIQLLDSKWWSTALGCFFPLIIRREVVKDQTGRMEIVLFNSVIDKVSNNTCYDFKKIEYRNSWTFVF